MQVGRSHSAATIFPDFKRIRSAMARAPSSRLIPFPISQLVSGVRYHFGRDGKVETGKGTHANVRRWLKNYTQFKSMSPSAHRCSMGFAHRQFRELHIAHRLTMLPFKKRKQNRDYWRILCKFEGRTRCHNFRSEMMLQRYRNHIRSIEKIKWMTLVR